jgi:hypothetical protein
VILQIELATAVHATMTDLDLSRYSRRQRQDMSQSPISRRAESDPDPVARCPGEHMFAEHGLQERIYKDRSK